VRLDKNLGRLEPAGPLTNRAAPRLSESHPIRSEFGNAFESSAEGELIDKLFTVL
jgi:hypothetical protein